MKIGFPFDVSTEATKPETITLIEVDPKDKDLIKQRSKGYIELETYLNDTLKPFNSMFKYMKSQTASKLTEDQQLAADAKESLLFFVMLNHIELIGYIKVDKLDKGSVYQNIWTIDSFVIEKDHAKKGFGKQALELLFGLAKKQKNIKAITLSVYNKNKNAISLYKALGFNDVTTRMCKEF